MFAVAGDPAVDVIPAVDDVPTDSRVLEVVGIFSVFSIPDIVYLLASLLLL